jgi:hypothetical protein
MYLVPPLKLILQNFKPDSRLAQKFVHSGGNSVTFL